MILEKKKCMDMFYSSKFNVDTTQHIGKVAKYVSKTILIIALGTKTSNHLLNEGNKKPNAAGLTPTRRCLRI